MESLIGLVNRIQGDLDVKLSSYAKLDVKLSSNSRIVGGDRTLE